jgi:hypothetical protein
VSGEYGSCRWRVDGVIKENGKSIVLKAAEYKTGIHRISLEAARDGAVYSKTGSFRVQE